MTVDDMTPSGMRILWQSFVDESVGAPYLAALRAHLGQSSPDAVFEVVGITPPDRAFGRLSEFRCSITAVANAIRAEEAGFDAVVFGHFQEPGLYEARASCGIPVIGIGEATLLWASQMGSRIGLVSIDPVYAAMHREQAQRYGLGSRLHAVRGLGVRVEDFAAAFSGDDAMRRSLSDAFTADASALVQDGCDVIVVAGGLYGLLMAQEQAPQVAGAPVVSCTPVGVAWAQMAVRLHRMTGIVASQSPSFARASAQATQDFLACLA